MSDAKAYSPNRAPSPSAAYPIKQLNLTRQLLLFVHNVWWRRYHRTGAQRPAEHLFYRMDLTQPLPREHLLQGAFFMAKSQRDVRSYFMLWKRQLGWLEAIKAALKILTGSQVFYGVVLGQDLIHTGWATRGFCRFYQIEDDAVVLESVWTAPAYRGRGLAQAALTETLAVLSQTGCRRFYIDTSPKNVASQRMISKVGFTRLSSPPSL